MSFAREVFRVDLRSFCYVLGRVCEMYLSLRSLRLCVGCKVGSFKSESEHQPFPSQSALDVILSAWIRSFYSSLCYPLHRGPPPFSPLTHTRLHARARLSFGSSSPEQQRAGEQKVDHHPKPQRNTATDHHRPKGCDIHQPLLACFALETLVEIVSCSDSCTGKTHLSHHPRTFSRLRHPGYILRFFGTLSFFGICSVSILCRLIPFPPRTSFSALYHRGRRRRRANWTKS